MGKYINPNITSIIIIQIEKLDINCLIFEFDLRKLGRTNIKTNIKNIAGIIWSTVKLIFYIITFFKYN